MLRYKANNGASTHTHTPKERGGLVWTLFLFCRLCALKLSASVCRLLGRFCCCRLLGFSMETRARRWISSQMRCQTFWKTVHKLNEWVTLICGTRTRFLSECKRPNATCHTSPRTAGVMQPMRKNTNTHSAGGKLKNGNVGTWIMAERIFFQQSIHSNIFHMPV